MIAVLALVMTACTKNELQTSADGPAAPEAVTTEAPVYHFSIPASIGDGADTKAVTIGETSITSEFANTDKVYMFIEGLGANAGKLAVAHNGTDASTYLIPSNINGTSCTLEGALKFYYNDNGNFAAFEPAENDVVYLCYNMNQPVTNYAGSIDMSSFYYGNNGSKDSHPDPYSLGASFLDFAKAKMKVTEVTGDATDGYTLTMVQYDDNTKSNVHFENIGSIFRQRLAFTDKNSQSIAIPTISELRIKLEGGDVVGAYYPFRAAPGDIYPASPIPDPIISAEGDVYFAMMFTDDNKNLPLVLEAVDENGNVYSVTKNAPTGGFKNGKYYYGSATLAWQKCIKPTVTGTSATPTYGTYEIPENPVNLTISGNSEDYQFVISEGHGGTITLDNLTATANGYFIYHTLTPADDVSLVLTGTNSISCSNREVISLGGNLKLSCTGTSATLTVTAWGDGYCGIFAMNYCDSNIPEKSNENTTTTELDVTTRLAAEGYSVTRSARTDNSDGTYTWTYTVRKLGKFSVGASKQVYFSPGNLQATTTDNWANYAFSFMTHQWDVVETNASPYCTDNYGGKTVVSLFGRTTSGYNNKYPYMTSTTSPDYSCSVSEISGTNYDWGHYNAIGTYPAGTWRTPAMDEWKYLLNVDGTSGRTDSYRFAKGTIHNTTGLIIFPDGFDPTAVGVTITNANTSNASFTSYSDADWNKMENAGCIFLPCAGYRSGNNVFGGSGNGAYYWSGTKGNSSIDGCYLHFYSGGINVDGNHVNCLGRSVRLVRDVPVAP